MEVDETTGALGPELLFSEILKDEQIGEDYFAFLRCRISYWHSFLIH